MSQTGSGVFAPTGALSPASTPLPARRMGRRSNRVVALTAMIALLSAADLYISLVYLRSVGMSEGNPLARWIMATESTSFLIWWKTLSVALGCGIFLYARRSRSAEIGAWLCCAVLVWLTVRWADYSREVTSLTPVLSSLSQSADATWVVNPG